MFQGYIDQLTPKLNAAGQAASAYAERTLAILHMIHESIQNQEFAEFHPRQSFTLTAGVQQDMNQIPTNEQWELEFLSCAGAATISINEGADLFRFAKQFTVADALPGIGLIFGGGTAPTIVAVGNATPIAVTVQFRRRQLRTGRRSPAGGMLQPGTDMLTPVNGDVHANADTDGRHAARFERANRNVNGERV